MAGGFSVVILIGLILVALVALALVVSIIVGLCLLISSIRRKKKGLKYQGRRKAAVILLAIPGALIINALIYILLAVLKNSGN
jgi:Ca2+/H+ antiporter